MTQSLKDRRILLVGGAGFIGHHLALTLQAMGANVHIVDSLRHNNLLQFAYKNPDLSQDELYAHIIQERLDLIREARVPLHAIDARDYHGLSRIFTEVQPQTVIQLAAIAHAGKSNKDPFSTFDNSLVTLENALDAARALKVEHFIFFSSSMVYGDFLTEAVDEDHPLNPIGIYGALKVAGEKITIAYQQVFDLPYTIIRPSALYGPRCVSRRVGQIFIESAFTTNTLRIDGDGRERLDFTYIDDLVHGVLQVMTHPGSRNQIFNLTYGDSRTINDMAGLVTNRFPDVELEFVERDRLMPMRGTLNVAKAREMIDYSPSNPLEVGFPKYIDWYERVFSKGAA